MAKTYRLNIADSNLIHEIAEPEILIPHVPRMETFFDGIKEMRDAQAQTSRIGKHTRSSAWTNDGKMQYAGTVPASIAAAVRELDDGFWEDESKVRWFFQHFPQYTVTSRVP